MKEAAHCDPNTLLVVSFKFGLLLLFVSSDCLLTRKLAGADLEPVRIIEAEFETASINLKNASFISLECVILILLLGFFLTKISKLSDGFSTRGKYSIFLFENVVLRINGSKS